MFHHFSYQIFWQIKLLIELYPYRGSKSFPPICTYVVPLDSLDPWNIYTSNIYIHILQGDHIFHTHLWGVHFHVHIIKFRLTNWTMNRYIATFYTFHKPFSFKPWTKWLPLAFITAKLNKVLSVLLGYRDNFSYGDLLSSCNSLLLCKICTNPNSECTTVGEKDEGNGRVKKTFAFSRDKETSSRLDIGDRLK